MKSARGTFSLDQLEEDGYTGPVPLLSAEEAAAARRAYFEAIGQSEEAPGPNSGPPYGFNTRYRWAHDLSVNERVLDHVETALGPDIVLWATVFWYKEPHNTKYIPWHQDASYWPMEPRINLDRLDRARADLPGERLPAADPGLAQGVAGRRVQAPRQE